MPLQDVSPNRNAQKAEHNGSKNNTNIAYVAHEPEPPHSAVQGMLKSTTEIDDVGIFAAKRARFPRSNTQSSMGRRFVRSSTSSKSRFQRRYDPSNALYASRHYGTPYIREDHTYAGHTRRRHPSGFSWQESWLPDKRSSDSRTMSGPAYARQQSHQISSHQLQGCRSMINLQSEEHYYDPTLDRSERVMQRAEGRAISTKRSRDEIYRQRSRLPCHDRCCHNVVPVGLRRLPNGSFYAAKRSMPSLRPSPFPSWHNFNRDNGQSDLIRRDSMPKSPTGIISERSSIRSNLTGHRWTTDSVIPLYYDYSESFHDDAAPFVRTPGFETVHEEVMHAGDNELLGSSHMHMYSIQLAGTRPFKPHAGPNSSLQLPWTDSTKQDSHELTRDTKQLPVELDGKPSNACPTTELNHSCIWPLLSRKELECSSTSHQENRPSPTAGTLFTNTEEQNSRKLFELAVRAHSLTGYDEVREMHKMHAASTAVVRNRNASDNAGGNIQDLDPLNTQAWPQVSSIQGSSQCIDAPELKHASIHLVSPRPERPASSHNRKKFSKIFDHDQEDYLVGRKHQDVPAISKLDVVEESVDHSSPPNNLSAPKPKAKSAITDDPGCLRSSGVQSNDLSTVESFLDKHIECLGLQANDLETANTPSVYSGSKHEYQADIPCNATPEKSASRSDLPTSLTPSEQQELMPRGLFSDPKIDSLRLDSSTEQVTADYAESLREDSRVSLGWQLLPSSASAVASKTSNVPSIMSGDLADVDTRLPTNSMDPANIPSSETQAKPESADESQWEDIQTSQLQPCPAKKSSSSSSKSALHNHRNFKMCLKSTASNSAGAISEDQDRDRAFDALSITDGPVPADIALQLSPISPVGGLAELSDHSRPLSPLSLASGVIIKPHMKFSDTWSHIVAAVPRTRRFSRRARRRSTSTVNSHQSQRSAVINPLNTSRPVTALKHTEVRVQPDAPQLGVVDLGSAIRMSSFGLNDSYKMRSPRSAPTIGDEIFTADADTPRLNDSRASTRLRFSSLRHILPKSPKRLLTSKIDRFSATKQTCQALKPKNPFVVNTIPFKHASYSNFKRGRRKFKDKLKDVWQDQCMYGHFLSKKRRTVPPGLLVRDTAYFW